jgi:hypothetical protein
MKNSILKFLIHPQKISQIQARGENKMSTFTKAQLFQVRNEIDIDWLISDKLNLERQFNGMWRFCCPLCQDFNTATQRKTNLSRCFSCQKNFNTIDLVIYSKKINFIPSVNFLLSLLKKPKHNVLCQQIKKKIPIKNRVSDKKIEHHIEKLRLIIR